MNENNTHTHTCFRSDTQRLDGQCTGGHLPCGPESTSGQDIYMLQYLDILEILFPPVISFPFHSIIHSFIHKHTHNVTYRITSHYIHHRPHRMENNITYYHITLYYVTLHSTYHIISHICVTSHGILHHIAYRISHIT